MKCLEKQPIGFVRGVSSNFRNIKVRTTDYGDETELYMRE